MTVFRIREPLEYPRTVQLATASNQALETSRGHEASMLELARGMSRADKLFEIADGFRGPVLYPLVDGTEILSCEVTL